MTQSNSVVSEILQELGWDSGLSIPIANELNKKLTFEVERANKDINHTNSELTYFGEKVTAVEDHLLRVKQEHGRVQEFLLAKNHTVELEEHMCKVSEREYGRLKQEVVRLHALDNELKQRINVHENTIFKQTSHLEEMRVQMNWDQQALEAWLEESEKKSEDSLALQKYMRQDDAKMRELTLQVERLTNESNDKRRKLDQEVVDTLTTQVELDKSAEEFRNCQRERQNLIEQWESTIQQMRRRDTEIDLLAAELARVKMTVREKEEIIREKEQFLKQEMDNNYESEKKVDFAERTAAKVRLDYQNAENQRQQFQSELEALRRTVDRTASSLEGTRSQVSHLKKEIIDKNNKLLDCKAVREKLQEKLKLVTDSKLSAEERAAQMDQLLNEEERRQKDMELELKLQRDVQFKRAQELYEVKMESKNIEATIMGSRAALRNLNSIIAKLDHDMLKRQEILYNQDFQIQQVERRINRMQGEKNNDEKILLEARIVELTEELEARQGTLATLTTQLKNLQDDIRRVKRHMQTALAEKGNITTKLDELHLHNETSQRELSRIESERQALLVEAHMKKLTIKNLRNQLNSKADEVMSLEKRKLQLNTAMKERRQEIAIHREMLENQIRQVEVERQQASSELHERVSKIQKLEKRYEILMVAMAPPEGEEEKSQAYYVIKAAQDKEELQRKGDALDAEIRKQEKEKRGLENALRVINSNNEQYRKGYTKVTDASDETAEKKRLDDQMRVALDKHKHKRRLLRELQEDIEAMRQTFANLMKDINLVETLQQEKSSELFSLQHTRSDHLTKMERAEKSFLRAQREFRANKGGNALPEELDIQVREMREYNRLVTKELFNVASQYPMAADLCSQFLQQAEIPLPSSTPGSQTSSRGSSRVSSAASSVASTARSSQTSASATRSTSRTGKAIIGGDLASASIQRLTPSASRRSSASSTASSSSRR